MMGQLTARLRTIALNNADAHRNYILDKNNFYKLFKYAYFIFNLLNFFFHHNISYQTYVFSGRIWTVNTLKIYMRIVFKSY